MSRERFCGNMQWISLAGKLESFFFAVPYHINLVNEDKSMHFFAILYPTYDKMPAFDVYILNIL